MKINLYQGSQERTFLGHPIGLSICFLTEMWERFSYYGMRAILVLYLVKYHLFSTEEASFIYAAYAGLVYMMPIIGGLFADKYLGAKKSVTYGAFLLLTGHFMMGFHGQEAFIENNIIVRDTFSINIFFLSLALIITGVGFLKPSISTIVGALYGANDPRRDGGFSIFYMGINLGSLISTALVGYIGEVYGWHYGFTIAGIGMLFGLGIFLAGQHLLDGRAEPPNIENLQKKIVLNLTKEHIIYIGGLLIVFLSWFLIQYQQLVGKLLGFSGLFMLGILIYYSLKKCNNIERDRLWVACFLISTQAIFWALFEQQAASLTLLADQEFNRSVVGVNILSSQVQLLNPLFIILFAPIMASLWVKLSKRKIEPSTPMKFAIAMILIGTGYIIFSWGLNMNDGIKKSFYWLIIIYFFLTISELCLSPVGLSMVTKLSTTRIVGLLMGTWFLFSAMGNYIAGWISSLTGNNSLDPTGSSIDIDSVVSVYNNIGIIGICLGIFIVILTPTLKKRMHGIN